MWILNVSDAVHWKLVRFLRKLKMVLFYDLQKHHLKAFRGHLQVLPEACNFIKKRLWHRCFPVNFVKFLRAPFLQNNSGRLLALPKSKSNRWSAHLIFAGVKTNHTHKGFGENLVFFVIPEGLIWYFMSPQLLPRCSLTK